MKPGQRLKAYLARKQNARGLDPDIIHAFDSGPDRGFECRASDVGAVLVLLDECERDLDQLVKEIFNLVDDGTLPDLALAHPSMVAAKNTLAKLRGEA